MAGVFPLDILENHVGTVEKASTFCHFSDTNDEHFKQNPLFFEPVEHWSPKML